MKARLAVLLLLILCAECYADMTIWFKDGSSVTAYKIVFKDTNADVYLLDGTVRNVRTDLIDLKSSGISKPVGTYGGQGSAPKKIPTVTPPTPVNQQARQKQLKEEWDRAEKKATALNNVGPIHKDDIVRIVGQTEAAPDPGYYGLPETKDDAYVVLYQNADGTFGKKLFDAVTFANHFRFQEKAKPTVTLPVEDKSNPPAQPVPRMTPAPTPPQTKEPEKVVEPEPKPETVPTVSEQPEEESTPVWPFAAGAMLVVGGILFFLFRKPKKKFVDTSKFSIFENELRDYEIEIWLKHGKTKEQLSEICIKKFYGDQPEAMAVISKIQKGLDKQALIAYIARQAGVDSTGAGQIFEEMKRRLEWIQSTIQSAMQKHQKTDAVAPASPQTGVMPVPGRAAIAPNVSPTGIMPAPGRAALAPNVAPTGIMSAMGPQTKAPAPSPKPATNVAKENALPAYLQQVHKNLSLFSSND